MVIKRATVALLGLAFAQLLMMGCEKNEAPDPWLCQHQFNEVVPLSKSNGSKLGPSIPFNKLERLIINDTCMMVTFTTDTVWDKAADTIISMKPSLDWVEYQVPIDMSTVGKIVFK
jgi:hypothetical protein